MIARYTLLVGVLASTLFAGSARTAEKGVEKTPYVMSEGTKKVARRYLAANTKDKAVAALKELKSAGVPENVVSKIAKSRYLKKAASFKRALTTFERPFRNLTNERRVKPFIKNADEWKTLADDALTFIFDDSKYAVPAKAMTGWVSGRDVQPNQGLVEGKVELAIEKWNEISADFASIAGFTVKRSRKAGGGGFGKKVKRNELKEPSNLVIPVLRYQFTEPTGIDTLPRTFGRGYADFRDEWKRLEPEIALAKAAGYQPEKIVLPSLPLALSALFADDLDAAVSFAPKAGTDNGKLFGIFVSHYLYAKSLKKPKEWSKAEHSALGVNNLYRMSLGLLPMLPDEKLHACAKDHSLYQKKNGLGHFQKDEDMRTVRHRARKAGYTAGVTENCSSGSLDDAIFSWRSDAGHHRNLIRRQSQVVGISTAGYPTHNTGYKCGDKELAKLFRFTY